MEFLGKSNAFEISKKLGLNQDIIDKAKSMISQKDVSIEELLKNIYDDKAKIESEKDEISKELEKISILRKELEKENFDMHQKEKEMLEKSKVEARNILLDAKEEVDTIIKKLNQESISNKDANILRNKLNDSIKKISNTSDSSNKKSQNSLKHLTKDEIKENTMVFVSNLGQEGIVLSLNTKSDEAIVQIGSMKMNVPIKFLEKSKNFSNISKNSKSNNISNLGYSGISKSKIAKTEINVIGQNVEDAIFIIDKFLDDSKLAKLQTVRIIHGKGTGKLRKGIWNFLKKHPHVKSFRAGTFGEGEMGVTVVELKK